MPVEFQVDTLDSVDEGFRPAYVEKDGKFTLDPDKYAEVKATGLKTKNKQLLDKLAEEKKATKRFEKLQDAEDDELEEFVTWRESKGQDNGKDGKKPDDAAKAHQEKLLKKERDKFTSEKTALETQLSEKDRELKHYKLTVPLKDAALKAGVLPDSIDLVAVDRLCRFQLDDKNKIVYLDEDGDPTDITPAKFFETIYKEMRPNLYKASGAAGSGAQNGTAGKSAGSKVVKRAAWDAMSTQERTAFVKDGGKVVD
jgi:hypothetical protein